MSFKLIICLKYTTLLLFIRNSILSITLNIILSDSNILIKYLFITSFKK